MVTKQINTQLWCISAVDSSIRGFYGDTYTEHGMMYNSFLVETEGNLVLLGAPPKRYVPQWMECVKGIAGKRKIGWAVLFGSHNERAAVNALLHTYPNATLMGGVSALYQLDGFLDNTPACVQICGKRKFEFDGKKLVFQTLPGIKDASAVYVIDSETGTLFTGDAFGANYASDAVVASEIGDKVNYLHGARQYYSEVTGVMRAKTMGCAVALVRENNINTICPAVGPVVDKWVEELLQIYEAAPVTEKTGPIAALVYNPGAYVEDLMSCVAAGIRDSGNVSAIKVDLSVTGREEAIRTAALADALLFGTTNEPANAKALWDVLTSLEDDACKGKTAATVYSVQSKDSNTLPLHTYLSARDFDRNTQDYMVQGKPDAQALKNAYEYGFAVGCTLQKIPNPHQPKLMKCLVCGEIFDASLGICPVCGVGLEQCVPVDEELVAFRNDTNNRYVILGGGVAAVSAAEAIRRRDKTGSIRMISAEPHLPINRPMLTKDLKVVVDDPERLRVHDAQWYQELDIAMSLGCTVTGIDPQAKIVITKNGEVIGYDKLIYAMGAECFVPPFTGHDKPGVITVRHLADALRLGGLTKHAKNAVVIGGGVLGLEAASEIMRAGVKVTILEATPQIVGRQVDSGSAAVLKATIQSMGAECYEGVTIAEIEGEDKATAVRLADGSVFPADFVVVSCGNRANVQVAKDAGINVERAIVVDTRMRTSTEDIYACGDCAQLDGVNYQLWQEASNQGKVAGANAAGDCVIYTNQMMGLSLEGFGTELFAIGDPGKGSNAPYHTVHVRDDIANRQETYWFHGGSLQGAVLIRASEKVASVSQAVATHARYEEIF